MKGTASSETLTGKVQRALTDRWQTQAQITAKARIYESKPATVRALLDRLVSEERAEQQVEHDHRYMSGGVYRWRRRQ